MRLVFLGAHRAVRVVAIDAIVVGVDVRIAVPSAVDQQPVVAARPTRSRADVVVDVARGAPT
jgi:hypothetical protein